jgi:hypothetical protein
MNHLSEVLLTNMPWGLRAATGHFLPLLLALISLGQLLPHWRSKHTPAFVGGMILAGGLLYLTSSISIKYIGGGHFSIAVLMMPLAAACIAGAIAFTCQERIPATAVWAGAFFPVYVVDLIRTNQIFKEFWTGMHGVGGAGPLDALLFTPALAVVGCLAFQFAAKTWNRVVLKS